MATQDRELVVVEQSQNAQIVRFLTDVLLDPMQVEKIREQLMSSLARSEARNLIVALDAVTQVSSLMLSVLISLREETSARGGEICLAAVPESVDYVLRATELDTIFKRYASVEEAAAALS